MKKKLILLVLSFTIFACSEDDSNDSYGTSNTPSDTSNQPDNTTTPEVGSVIINEVAYLNSSIELFNNGNGSLDVSNYFLCLGPGSYVRVGDIVTSGNTSLAAGAYLVLNYDRPTATGGLGLYANNADFTDANNMVAFVQWGAAGSARENVATAAGLWTAGQFVPVIGNSATSIAYDGNGNAVSDWEETAETTFGAENAFITPEISVVFNEVEFLGDQVELYNNGNVAVDLSEYQMCLGPGGTYRKIEDLPFEGNVILGPQEYIVVTYDQINQGVGRINGEDGTGGLGLWMNGDDFTDEATLVDFVQWGASGSPRENVAVAAGIWTEGDFIAVSNIDGNTIIYDGDGESSEDWAETTTSTFGTENSLSSPEINSVIINEVEYLVDDEIELYNNGTTTIDLTNYWMCFGPGQYFRIGDAATTTIVTGNINLEPGSFLVLSPVTLPVPDDQGGLGLYANNDAFGNAANIRSFVQWGTSGSARENVAVTAGIWNAGDFIPNVDAGSSIAYDGNGFNSTDWVADETPSLGSGNGSGGGTSTPNYFYSEDIKN